MHKISTLYPLNLYNTMYQLYLNFFKTVHVTKMVVKVLCTCCFEKHQNGCDCHSVTHFEKCLKIYLIKMVIRALKTKTND